MVTHRELLRTKHPEFAEVTLQVARDLEQLARLCAIAGPSFDNEALRNSFTNTYRGNAFAVVRNSLAREISVVCSRLFHTPRWKGKGAAIDLGNSDRSLVLLSELIRTDSIRKTRLKDAFRFGASGSFLVTENGSCRTQSIWETRKERIARGNAQVVAVKEDIARAVAEIEAFSKSSQYGKVRVFRTESVAHNLHASADRKRFKFSGETLDVSFDELDRASQEIIRIGESSCVAFFGHHLSLESHRRIWSDYAQLFWKKFCRSAFHAADGLTEDD